MTRLYVVRHAVAEEKREGLPDAERALTGKGRSQFRKAAKAFRAMDVSLDRLLHSPKRRAVETAEPLARYVEGDTVAIAALARAPDAALLDEIRGETVAVVGHEPFLGQLA